MSSTALIMLALKGSLALMVLGVGLRSTKTDATYLLRHPALFARSFLAMSVLMPLLALCLGVSFALHPVVSRALVALTLSPIPPFLPNKAAKAGGDAPYMVSLFVVTSLVSIVVAPLSVALIGAVFGSQLQVRPGMIAKLVAISVVIPLVAGIVIRHFFPSAAERAAKPIGLVSTVAVVLALLPLLVASWPAMRTLIGNGTLVVIIGLTLAGLALGHLLGGPDQETRTDLALATPARHPAVAIAMLSANLPGERLVAAAVILSLIVGALAAVPYAMWAKRGSRLHTSARAAGQRASTVSPSTPAGAPRA